MITIADEKDFNQKNEAYYYVLVEKVPKEVSIVSVLVKEVR